MSCPLVRMFPSCVTSLSLIPGRANKGHQRAKGPGDQPAQDESPQCGMAEHPFDEHSLGNSDHERERHQGSICMLGLPLPFL